MGWTVNRRIGQVRNGNPRLPDAGRTALESMTLYLHRELAVKSGMWNFILKGN